jgi:hypothetical protein
MIDLTRQHYFAMENVRIDALLGRPVSRVRRQTGSRTRAPVPPFASMSPHIRRRREFPLNWTGAIMKAVSRGELYFVHLPGLSQIKVQRYAAV